MGGVRRNGEAVQAVVEPATQEFVVKDEVSTVGAKEKGELRLTREPGADAVVVSGTLPAKSAAHKLVLAIQEPAQHAARLLARLLTERGVTWDGTVRAQHDPDPGHMSGRRTRLRHS